MTTHSTHANYNFLYRSEEEICDENLKYKPGPWVHHMCLVWHGNVMQ